jgi:NADH-quinone oxidoreductase subunit L
MTAFYMFRAVFMTFHGKYRGGAAGEHGGGHGEHAHLHESPMVMVLPMLLLAGLAIGSGWLNVNGWFDRFFGGHHLYSWTHAFTLFTENHYLPLISFVIALLGIDLANAIYNARWISAEAVGRTFSTFYRVFYRKYWMDELYEKVFVVRFLLNTVFRVCQVFDTYVVDGIVNGLAGAAVGAGRVLRVAETGRLQTYGLIMALGVVVIVAFVYWFT